MAVHTPISRFATEPFVCVAGFEGPVRAERIKITPRHLAAATRRVRSGGRLVMTTLDHDLLIAILDRLKLTAIRDQLDTLMSSKIEQFSFVRELDGFGFDAQPSVCFSQPYS
ncbi:hypothetical protein [Mesorhizobium australicum]|uniref:hypothetical protein n=1 Tax=Mesorhizobium australicum TaxID=536018 RepID=UPI0033372F6D